MKTFDVNNICKQIYNSKRKYMNKIKKTIQKEHLERKSTCKSMWVEKTAEKILRYGKAKENVRGLEDQKKMHER